MKTLFRHYETKYFYSSTVGKAQVTHIPERLRLAIYKTFNFVVLHSFISVYFDKVFLEAIPVLMLALVYIKTFRSISAIKKNDSTQF